MMKMDNEIPWSWYSGKFCEFRLMNGDTVAGTVFNIDKFGNFDMKITFEGEPFKITIMRQAIASIKSRLPL